MSWFSNLGWEAFGNTIVTLCCNLGEFTETGSVNYEVGQNIVVRHLKRWTYFTSKELQWLLIWFLAQFKSADFAHKVLIRPIWTSTSWPWGPSLSHRFFKNNAHGYQDRTLSVVAPQLRNLFRICYWCHYYKSFWCSQAFKTEMGSVQLFRCCWTPVSNSISHHGQ